MDSSKDKFQVEMTAHNEKIKKNKKLCIGLFVKGTKIPTGPTLMFYTSEKRKFPKLKK